MAIIKREKKLSIYGRQLKEKQELKKIYGLRESQMRNYVGAAVKMKGNTAENLLILLERRVDNVFFRLGFAKTRAHGRQLASHGAFLLNDNKITIPSILVRQDDVIRPRKLEKFTEVKPIEISWIKFDDKEKMSFKVASFPTREEIDTLVDENIVMQFYSR